MRYHLPSRRGNVAVIIAVCLTVLIGFTALVLDGGLIQHYRRSAQAASDAAAMAAASDLFLNFPTYNGLDGTGTAALKAKAVAAANGFNNDGVNNRVIVNVPPTSGIHMGKPAYVEVIIEHYQPRNFSAIWGSAKTTVRARAVAEGNWAPFRNGILVLDPTSSGALNDNGGAVINVLNADVIVNSTAADGAVVTGGGWVGAPNFYLSGDPGYTTTGGGATINGTILSNQMPTPDPLAYLTPPNPDTLILQSNNKTHTSNRILTLDPGVYKGGIDVSGQGGLIMNPGIYYMDGGGFSFTGLGNLTALGVMIYVKPNQNSDVISINGNGAINMTPMATGMYAGISIWQDRASTNTINIQGNGTSSITGTFYAAHGTLAVSGNGAQDVLGSQYISYQVNLGGTGNFNIDWSAPQSARTRILRLVE